MTMLRRLSPEKQGCPIEIELPDGTLLLLTWKEYATAIQRGKWERRRKQMKERMESRPTAGELKCSLQTNYY